MDRDSLEDPSKYLDNISLGDKFLVMINKQCFLFVYAEKNKVRIALSYDPKALIKSI